MRLHRSNHTYALQKGMAIAYDKVGDTNSGGEVSPLDFKMVRHIASSGFGDGNITMNVALTGLEASDKLIVALINVVNFNAVIFTGNVVFLNEVAGTLLVTDYGDGGAGEGSAIYYWKDADVPSEDGTYGLRMNVGQKRLYSAGVFVFEGVNQLDPIGHSGILVDTAVSNNQDFDMVVPDEVGSPAVLSLGLGDLNPANPPAIGFSENLTEMDQEWFEDNQGDGWNLGAGYAYGMLSGTNQTFTGTNVSGNSVDIGIALVATINLN